MAISKRDLFTLTPEQRAAGRKMWERTTKTGKLCLSSEDYERTAVKTWIRYVDSKGAELAVLECEIYRTAESDGRAVGVLNGMCPKCGECFLANEGNKTMHIGAVEYRRAPAWLKVHWEHYQKSLNRFVSDSDKIPVVASPERWACDYCKSWCVKVTDGVASDDHRGVAVMYSSLPLRALESNQPSKDAESTFEV